VKAWAPFALVCVVLFAACPALADQSYPIGGGAAVRASDVRVVALREEPDSVRKEPSVAAQAEAMQDKLERLVFFTPRGRSGVVDRFARALQRRRGGALSAYETFFESRMHEFESMVARYDMHPNDLSTALAFAIVAGYRAYNGDHLRDETSGSIFRTVLALEMAAPQWNNPWSDAHKQDVYLTLGLEGALLTWLADGAQGRGAAAQAAVRVEARDQLTELLGRNPDTVRLDSYACTFYTDGDCSAVVQRLRAQFQAVAHEPTEAQSP
jgi:hypothetical protein